MCLSVSHSGWVKPFFPELFIFFPTNDNLVSSYSNIQLHTSIACGCHNCHTETQNAVYNLKSVASFLAEGVKVEANHCGHLSPEKGIIWREQKSTGELQDEKGLCELTCICALWYTPYTRNASVQWQKKEIAIQNQWCLSEKSFANPNPNPNPRLSGSGHIFLMLDEAGTEIRQINREFKDARPGYGGKSQPVLKFHVSNKNYWHYINAKNCPKKCSLLQMQYNQGELLVATSNE